MNYLSIITVATLMVAAVTSYPTSNEKNTQHLNKNPTNHEVIHQVDNTHVVNNKKNSLEHKTDEYNHNFDRDGRRNWHHHGQQRDHYHDDHKWNNSKHDEDDHKLYHHNGHKDGEWFEHGDHKHWDNGDHDWHHDDRDWDHDDHEWDHDSHNVHKDGDWFRHGDNKDEKVLKKNDLLNIGSKSGDQVKKIELEDKNQGVNKEEDLDLRVAELDGKVEKPQEEPKVADIKEVETKENENAEATSDVKEEVKLFTSIEKSLL